MWSILLNVWRFVIYIHQDCFSLGMALVNIFATIFMIEIYSNQTAFACTISRTCVECLCGWSSSNELNVWWVTNTLGCLEIWIVSSWLNPSLLRKPWSPMTFLIACRHNHIFCHIHSLGFTAKVKAWEGSEIRVFEDLNTFSQVWEN